MHIHTVFSDGEVWPHVRVDEAIAEGLDVISITDHVETLEQLSGFSLDLQVHNALVAPGKSMALAIQAEDL